MSPEQRLTIREAVEMIARYGAAPISESALRARIRNRKIGVVKVEGRIYTNPLNLVTAGLLPVDLLTGLGATPEIDDAELHAWLNPDDTSPPLDASPLVEPVADALTAPDTGSEPPERSDSDGNAGPLERALSTPAGNDDGATQDFRPPRPSSRRQVDERRPSNRRWRRRPGAVRRGAVLAVATSVAVAGMAAIGLVAMDQETTAEVAQIRPLTLASAVQSEPPVQQIERAMKDGEYERALDLAALSGDRALLARTQRTAADAVLTRAERARKDGRLGQARRNLRTVTASFGDPRPAATKTIATRIDRDERAARQQARARRTSTPSPTPPSDGAATSTPTVPAPRPAPSPATSSSAQSGSTGGSAKPKRDEDEAVDPGLF